MFKTNLFSKFPFLSNGKNRDEWIRNKLLAIPDGMSILDAGAGECPYKIYCSHLNYTSQDFGKYDGVGDSVGLQTAKWDNSRLDIVSDITAIPVESASFDYILCSEVIEHVPFPDQAVKEMARILKSGGRLILTSPFCSQTHFAPYHFCTGFNIYWYETVLGKYDLELEEVVKNGNYFDYVLQELTRLPIVGMRFSSLKVFSLFLYLFIIPLVFILFLFSLVCKDSSSLMCFGYQVVAKKK